MLSGRGDEARDAGLVCFQLPMYTAGRGLTEILEVGEICGMDGLEGMREFVEKVRERERQEMMKSGQGGKTERDTILEKARNLLDNVSLGGGGMEEKVDWEGGKGELAGLYKEAGGCDELAEYVAK